ncbi:hypothetical protein CERSUDRAFT_99465 [Gelatoporia subvermispora B]|uniref:Uncharacterized protein n=1 Tax=Ceriporiopsis subvermispora (strain B) TaxID=914234 RepID=M2PA69_CERS8|nr:hypothetical protein CERSUDRAFT_99465 [Gelatoporia subvermispora B]
MAKLAKLRRLSSNSLRRLLPSVSHFTLPPSLSKRVASDVPLPVVPARPACIALQNEDLDEDAVVITALRSVPFCCHADLATMPRAALLGVAHTLNAALPAALRIDAGPARSDATIRRAIERLVGIRPANTPAAQDQSASAAQDQSVPISTAAGIAKDRASLAVPSPDPATMTTRSRSNMSLSLSIAHAPSLGVLREADEDPPASPAAGARPQKKRRVLRPPATPPDFDARRITRAQAHRLSLPALPALDAHPNITTTRGRGARRSQSAVLTSTPKRPGRTGTGRGLALGDVNSLGRKALQNMRNGVLDMKGTPRAEKGAGLKRKASEASLDEGEVTFGIDGLTMPIAGSDLNIDISLSI